ncbi:MAG: Flp pilus assembly protein CpaB [Litoreibacter sp.]|nr:Flp pilus assembly protein CpaB [Litoreibacter sp.]
MRLVFGLVLVIGIGLAGFAAYMAKNRIGEYQATLETQRAQLAKNVKMSQVFVVKDKVTYGERIEKSMVKLVAWPDNAIPKGAFSEVEDLFPANGELRTALRVMEADEAILKVKVTKPGEDAGVSSRLAKGMRAFALRVDVSSGVSGFLRPGDRVDVYWTGDADGREVTKLIDTGVQLIAVDQTADGDRTSPTIARTVTAAVTPQQVAALALAQSTGRLTLALIGAGDTDEVAAVSVDQNELLGIQEKVKIERKAERVCTIKTRKGADVVEIPIPCTN